MNIDQLAPQIQQRLATLPPTTVAALLPSFFNPRGYIRVSLVNTPAGREAFKAYCKACGLQFALTIVDVSGNPVFVAVEKPGQTNGKPV